ncbi:GerMN domain-containing protein [Fusobacterium sp.]|uniref:GerMN domain-containing protein n=1 Tax=Fusobacterium sp. TaxID=68766 RepID=UPI002635A762|nr:GerMN domain-containing protein [Fusobacterium sp.]
MINLKKNHEKENKEFEEKNKKNIKGNLEEEEFSFNKKRKKTSSKSGMGEVLKELKIKLINFKEGFFNSKNSSIKIMSILWIITIFSGYLYFSSKDNTPKVVFERESLKQQNEKEKLYIYYPEKNKIANKEIEVEKNISKSSKIRRTLDETLNELKTLEKIPNINEKTEVYYYIVNNIIYLDLPEKLFDRVKSPTDELLIIYSIVNTMTNIDTNLDTVKILINGADMDKVKYANLKRDFKFRKDI